MMTRRKDTRMSELINVEELFGSRVFTHRKMKERLPKGVFKELDRVKEQVLTHLRIRHNILHLVVVHNA